MKKVFLLKGLGVSKTLTNKQTKQTNKQTNKQTKVNNLLKEISINQNMVTVKNYIYL